MAKKTNPLRERAKLTPSARGEKLLDFFHGRKLTTQRKIAAAVGCDLNTVRRILYGSGPMHHGTFTALVALGVPEKLLA